MKYLFKYDANEDSPIIVKRNPSDSEIKDWLNTKLPPHQMTGLGDTGEDDTTIEKEIVL